MYNHTTDMICKIDGFKKSLPNLSFRAKPLSSIFIVFLFILVFLSGCTIKSIEISRTIKLPEYIYKSPLKNYYSNATVGIFKFQSPVNASQVGYAAASTFHKRLLLNKVFFKVVQEFDVEDLSFENLIKIAEKKHYELIITGVVRYYMEGSSLQESMVDEQIQVIHVPTKETLWYAEAVETGRPVSSLDYIFFKIKDESAPSTASLMSINAQKMCNMLLSISPYYAALKKDMKWIDDGYNYLVAKDYDKAEFCFKKALSINPDNPYAFLNLGVVYERQGNTGEAITMYQKVIELNPEIVVKESTNPQKTGYTLVDIAKDNLKMLQQ
ncbi:MAG: tetratricopeptide repeat protein [Thermodesulfobacteriota bacterium]|nr:tetratricopeptide repeat protein [Thermodesulfobacteriota bacterium]